MKRIIFMLIATSFLFGCDFDNVKTTDQKIQKQQEKILAGGNAQAGIPAIKNFREKKIMKMILELRDQEDISTYTYIVAEQTGKLVLLGESIGYAIPAATQYTNPQQDIYTTTVSSQHMALPQADPNGLFSPSSAEGSWVMMKRPDNKAHAVYIEPRVIVSPFKFQTN